MDSGSLAGIPAQDRKNARQYFQDFCAEMAADSEAVAGSDQEWLKRIEARADKHLWADSCVGRQLLQTVYALHRDESDYQPPNGFEPGMIDGKDAPLRKFIAVQAGGELQFVPRIPCPGQGMAAPWLCCRVVTGLFSILFLSKKDVGSDPHDLEAGQSRIHRLQTKYTGQQEHLSLPATADELLRPD